MTAQPAEGLTPEQLAFFNENGYLLIPDALSQDIVKQLLEDTNKMLNDFSLDDHPMTRFSTGGDDGADHVGDDYFLESGDKVRFFFEEDAFDATGQLTKPKHRAINKIGHYLHELSPSFRAISLSARNTAIARSLGFRDPRVLQSMVICKQPEIGGAVPPHQDSTFLYTDPPSAVGWWYALEDATAENGCLSFAAGSHKRASIEKRFVRMGKGTGFIDNEGARFPENLDTEVNGEKEYEVVEKEEVYDMGEVKAGTLVLIHGNILHKSEKNTSDKSRNIYTFHVIEGERRYDERNWLQPPEKGFSMLFPKQAEMNELYKKKVTMLHEQWRDEKAGTNEHDADKAERLHETWSEEGAATKRSKLDKDEWLVEKRLDQRPPTNNVGTDASNRLAKDW